WRKKALVDLPPPTILYDLSILRGDCRGAIHCAPTDAISLNRTKIYRFGRLPQSHRIPVDPAFRNLATCDAENGDTRYRHRFPTWGDTPELVLVSGLHLPANDHFIPFGDQFLYRPLSVGEGIKGSFDSTLGTRKTWVHPLR